MTIVNHLVTFLTGFLALVYVSGAIGFCINPAFFAPFTPFNLLFTAFVFLIVQYKKSTGNRIFFIFLVISLIGFVSEVIGVKTGYVFGNYVYLDGLGIKFLNVPLVISLNWAIMVCCGAIISFHFFKSSFLASLVSASLITAVDLLIEQSAPKLNFWIFENGMPGWHNYIGWWCLSFLATYWFRHDFSKLNRMVAYVVLSLISLFFTVVYLFGKPVLSS